MARYEHLPIFADSYRLALLIEQQVAGFRNQICLMKAPRMKQSSLYLFGFMIGLIVGAITAHADDLSDLEKLQRQIDAAKAAKQSKPAAAPAPKRKTTHAPVHAEAAPPAPQGSMTEAGAGILRHNATGLLWTQSDNGADIDWHDATRYCSAKGDWRLPTREEFKSLEGGSETTPCGYFFTCSVSSKFRLTDELFWTSEMYDSSEAWSVHLYNGNQSSTHWTAAATPERCVCGVPEHGAG